MGSKTSSVESKSLRKGIIAAAIGNFITWFEYASYGFLAVILSNVFFPDTDKTTALLATFGAFGISFLMNPLGAFVFGQLGDKYGRKKILTTVILLMSGSTFAIGLLPSYAEIGLISPILMIILRMLQGFAAGGEPGGAATYLVESAKVGKKAHTVSYWHCSSYLANASAAAFILILTSIISTENLQAWGWRIPFLIAGLLGIVAYWIRTKMEDTAEFKALEEANDVCQAPVKEALKYHWKEILQTAGCMALQGAVFYFIFVYIQAYLVNELNLTFLQASISNVICLVTASITIFTFAKLSDRVGRKPILLLGSILSVLLIYPVFLVFSTGIFSLIVLGQATLAIGLAIFMSASGAALVEIFPTRVRYAGFSIGFNLSVAIFGGSAAYVATYLIKITQSPMSPALIVFVTSLIGVITVLTMRETAGTKVDAQKLASAKSIS
ncbi:MFS transporter [Acinetobacter sp. UC24323]|uniref:MFS transporter n=1 Tax=Acinetobacter TaxID=469 RepID=UPI0020A190AC|nr:MFS transporter [Acinetobacter sp. UC24323]MCO9051576.1 MFS transporter [Acinetobacter sp. UC24323]MDC4466776.1 MFS transporter [Acinetobacter baumannii]